MNKNVVKITRMSTKVSTSIVNDSNFIIIVENFVNFFEIVIINVFMKIILNTYDEICFSSLELKKKKKKENILENLKMLVLDEKILDENKSIHSQTNCLLDDI